jgi:hypothetical protein
VISVGTLGASTAEISSAMVMYEGIAKTAGELRPSSSSAFHVDWM